MLHEPQIPMVRLPGYDVPIVDVPVIDVPSFLVPVLLPCPCHWCASLAILAPDLVVKNLFRDNEFPLFPYPFLVCLQSETHFQRHVALAAA